MAKYVLNNSKEEFNFFLIGITCPINQYEMVSLINNCLQIDLSLNSFVELKLKKNKIFSFSLFTFLDEDLGIDYVFIPNLSNFETQSALNVINENNLFKDQVIEEQVRLLNELPKTDYLIMLKGEDVINYRFKISDQLKKRNAIIQLQNIEPSTLPSKRNLIF